jgi:hypothetical protein
MFHVTPNGVLVFEIKWDNHVLQFPADLNKEGDRLCQIEDETMWQLNWTINTSAD